MLVEIVLAAGGQYWRRHVELLAIPVLGTTVPVLEEPALQASVTGSDTELTGDRAAGAAVLVRAPAEPAAPAAALRRAGWHLLV